MLRNILFVAAAAAIVALVAVTTDAMAGSSTSAETGKQHARSAARSAPQHNHRRAAHRTFTDGFRHDAEPYYPVRSKVLLFRGQGYVYVPRKGIADEACNLPTSACPNEMRDVQ
jgi:hypothetical protein